MKYHEGDPDPRFELLKAVDAQRVVQYVEFKLLSQGDPGLRLEFLYHRQRAKDFELLEQLEVVGSTVEHIDEVLGIDDEQTAYKAYLCGLTIALEIVDSILYELSINAAEFRRYWKAHEDFVGISVPDKEEGYSRAELHELVGRQVVESGERQLYLLDVQYLMLIEKIDDLNFITGSQSNVFKASYGFVAGKALEILTEMLREQDLDTFEKEISQSTIEWDNFLKDSD